MIKKLTLVLILFAHNTYAFMAGIDERRDTHGELEIIGAYIPMAPPGMMNAGYLKLKNTSNKKIIFHQFTSPVWDSIEIHNVEHNGGVAKMRKMSKLVILEKSTLELKPGSVHLMLIGPRRDIKEGEEILMIGLDDNERRYMFKFIVTGKSAY
ncbi:MAG: copper chaperone PCu(A)C [Pseudomonadota bacterium]|nr:copper chaperone PCu(A)C [Pseudomonadota bacterium]